MVELFSAMKCAMLISAMNLRFKSPVNFTMMAVVCFANFVIVVVSIDAVARTKNALLVTLCVVAFSVLVDFTELCWISVLLYYCGACFSRSFPPDCV